MNYLSLLHFKPKKGNFLILLFTFFIVIVYFANIKIIDSITIKGIANKNIITINTTIDNVNLIINGKYLVIEKNKYNYKINQIYPPVIDERSLISYQVVELQISKQFMDNQVVTMAFHYQEEKLKEKIKSIVIGG